MIAVFLNNKLISCDTILPLLYEAKAESDRRDVEFYCFNKQTSDAIQSNVILYNLINRLGSLILLTNQAPTRLGLYIQRVRTFILVSRLSFLALIGRATFIHFKALNEWPWRVLYYMNRQRTYFSESSVVGFTEKENRLMALQGVSPSSPKRIFASGLINFHKSWKILDHDDAKKLHIYRFGSPRERQHWLTFIQDESDLYFEKEFLAARLDNADEIIVFILGYMGSLKFMKNPESMKMLFRETLFILSELRIDRPIFLKPHAVTDEKFIRELISDFPKLNIVITRLHPAVLATRARFFIANYYSNTFYDARVFGVPTIEYTEYSDELSHAMKGESIRPEFVTHFIPRDMEKLAHILSSIVSRPVKARYSGPTSDNSGLLKELKLR